MDIQIVLVTHGCRFFVVCNFDRKFLFVSGRWLLSSFLNLFGCLIPTCPWIRSRQTRSFVRIRVSHPPRSGHCIGCHWPKWKHLVQISCPAPSHPRIYSFRRPIHLFRAYTHSGTCLNTVFRYTIYILHTHSVSLKSSNLHTYRHCWRRRHLHHVSNFGANPRNTYLRLPKCAHRSHDFDFRTKSHHIDFLTDFSTFLGHASNLQAINPCMTLHYATQEYLFHELFLRSTGLCTDCDPQKSQSQTHVCNHFAIDLQKPSRLPYQGILEHHTHVNVPCH